MKKLGLLFLLFALTSCAESDQFIADRMAALKDNTMSPQEKFSVAEGVVKQNCVDSPNPEECENNEWKKQFEKLQREEMMYNRGSSWADIGSNIQRSAYSSVANQPMYGDVYVNPHYRTAPDGIKSNNYSCIYGNDC